MIVRPRRPQPRFTPEQAKPPARMPAPTEGPAPERMTVPQVWRRLKLPSYRHAYELVHSGQLGDVVESVNRRTRTVSAGAVDDYLAKQQAVR